MTAPPAAGSCGAPGCPRSPAVGRLCPSHRQHLGQVIADFADDLVADPSPALIGWRTGSTSSGALASQRDPLNLRLLDAQREAPSVLAAWAAWVRDGRDLTHPSYAGPEADRRLLAIHLDWIVTQPEAEQFWCQIRSLWSHLRGHRPVRRCTCGGPVWTDRGGGWCSWCSTAWVGAQLLGLPRPVEGAA